MLFFKMKEIRKNEEIISALIKASRSSATQINSNTNEGIRQLSEKAGKDNKNINLRLDELFDLIDENTGEFAQTLQDKCSELNARNNAAVKALIRTADLIEDFYVYAKKYADPEILSQAGLMWANACKALNAAGLTRIADENTIFDPAMNHIQATAGDPLCANDAVTEVLRSGYIYNNTVIRKSEVIVNKAEDKA